MATGNEGVPRCMVKDCYSLAEVAAVVPFILMGKNFEKMFEEILVCRTHYEAIYESPGNWLFDWNATAETRVIKAK